MKNVLICVLLLFFMVGCSSTKTENSIESFSTEIVENVSEEFAVNTGLSTGRLLITGSMERPDGQFLKEKKFNEFLHFVDDIKNLEMTGHTDFSVYISNLIEKYDYIWVIMEMFDEKESILYTK